ncbi:MAG TPA: hypothetical protein VKU89_10840 [Solirubrobacteraceae bacterium]|nr:hypothetical protein [Solirubrobacteraceae bacterium]
MKSPKLAILVPAVTLLMAVTPMTSALAAGRGHAHTTALSRSDSSRDVSEGAGNRDRSRSDNGRSDSSAGSPDRSVDGHEAGDR